MKILFISRAFPPVVGGMENQNWELSRQLPKLAETRTIANRKGKMALPYFLPYALLVALFTMRKYDVLLLGDGVLGIVGWAVKTVYGNRKKVVVVTHGLDLTFKMPLYSIFWVKLFIPSCDRIIAVGNETIRTGVELGIPREKFVFIPNGVDTKAFAPTDVPRSELEKILGTGLDGKKVILTSGRLARRKGVAWFIRHVLPKLPGNILYVVAGDGPDRENIAAAVSETDSAQRVFRLGYVTDEVRNTLFHTCDLFVQPNIRIPGTMEGFGLTVLEAASSGVPVLASNLEGLPDAIQDGKNGFLVDPENPSAWASKISEVLSDSFNRKAFGRAAHAYVDATFSWDGIAKKYLETLMAK